MASPTPKKYTNLSQPILANDVDGFLEVLGLLEQRGKPVLGEDLTKIMLLNAGKIKPSMVEVLLSNGASLRSPSGEEDLAFHALSAKNFEVVRWLLEEKHIDANRTVAGGLTLLMVALRTSDEEMLDFCDELVSYGADVNATTGLLSGQSTALHRETQAVSFQSIVWLIRQGANPNIVDSDNRFASEYVPEKLAGDDWDLDALFTCLEDYRAAYNKGEPFEVPEVILEMAHKEFTPMSQMEGMMQKIKDMQKAQEAKQNESVDIVPQPKGPKKGF